MDNPPEIADEEALGDRLRVVFNSQYKWYGKNFIPSCGRLDIFRMSI